jgi:hypothetical protein
LFAGAADFVFRVWLGLIPQPYGWVAAVVATLGAIGVTGVLGLLVAQTKAALYER